MTGWTEDGLLRMWRVLARQEDGAEWQIGLLTGIGPVSVKAGCRFPGGREALVVGLPRVSLPDQAGLPDGKGFDVQRLTTINNAHDRTSIALVRRPEGSLDIFTVISTDLIRHLEASGGNDPGELAEAFIGRVADWQEFMARKRRPLSSERQLGLAGELWFLDRLMRTDLGPAALDCWQGPLHAAQDFLIASGAVEVKSSLAGGSFLARINSIEQLDTERTPMVLAALRFEVADDGIDLVERVGDLRDRMQEAGLSRVFEALLMLSGYLDDHADHYRRRLRLVDARAHEVVEGFPCLRRQAVPPQVRKAVYTLDVDAIEQPSMTIDDALHMFGVISDES